MSALGRLAAGLRPVGAVVQQGRRAALAQGLDATLVGAPRHPGPTLLVANHTGRVDRQVITSLWPTPVVGHGGALVAGLSGLVFPEGGISPDGSLGRFRPDLLEPLVRLWRWGSTVTVTPVAVSGTFGLDAPLPWWASPTEKAHVVVRAGTPLQRSSVGADELAEQLRDAVAALAAESASTWWRQRRDPAPVAAAAEPSWRAAWLNSGRELAPGQNEPPRIWS